MKLKYRGNINDFNSLPLGNLPDSAVPFDEPKTPEGLIKELTLFIKPLLIVLGAVIGLVFIVRNRTLFSLEMLIFIMLGLLSSVLAVFPHEFLHAICFSKDAEVDLYISTQNLMAFVISNEPVSKVRFIFMSLLPAVVLGWIPFLIWMFVLMPAWISGLTMGFSLANILYGIGDYFNAYNAYKQMPKGSYQQLSGFNSYWFKPL